MSVLPRYPIETAHVLSTLELACRALADAAARLDESRAAAGALVAETDWQTSSARYFHAQAEAWHRDLDALRDTIAYLCDEVGSARGRAVAAAWWSGA